jgi:hypothetical protein
MNNVSERSSEPGHFQTPAFITCLPLLPSTFSSINSFVHSLPHQRAARNIQALAIKPERFHPIRFIPIPIRYPLCSPHIPTNHHPPLIGHLRLPLPPPKPRKTQLSSASAHPPPSTHHTLPSFRNFPLRHTLFSLLQFLLFPLGSKQEKSPDNTLTRDENGTMLK